MWSTKFLRQNQKGFFVFKRTFLSQQYKATMEQRIEPPQLDRSLMKSFGQSVDLVPFEVEHFLSTISVSSSMDDRRGELYEKLEKMRSSKVASCMPQTLNHGVINYLITTNLDDLLYVLAHRIKYGVFVDAFSGSYLMNILLEKKDYQGAVQVAAELLLQEENDELVQSLSLLSAFEYVRNNLTKVESAQTDATKTEGTESKSKEKPQKVRVKFLRNAIENELISTLNVNSNLAATVLTKSIKNVENPILKENGKLIAAILNKDYKSLESQLNGATESLCKDAAEIGLELLKTENEENTAIDSIKQRLEKLKETSKLNFSESLNESVKAAIAKLESSLIDERKKSYAKWLADREEQLKNVIETQAKFLRQAEIEETLADINKKKQQLWFFETQDKIDMEIFRKQVRYPKRWFGKKKKPRMIDDNYVPPEIRNK